MITWVSATIGLCVAVTIILLVRRDHLHARDGVRWVIVAIAFAAAGLFPGALDQVAGRLGIAYPPILALILGVALLVVKILLMDIERSRMEVRLQRLTQRLAMLETDLRTSQEDRNPTE